MPYELPDISYKHKIYNKMERHVNYRICEQAGALYEYIAKKGFDVPTFSDAYLKSDFCNYRMDSVYSVHQFEPPNLVFDMLFLEIKDALVPFDKADETIFSPAVAFFCGFFYRQLFFETDLRSRDLPEKVPFEALLRGYPGLHTIDLGMASDDICRTRGLPKINSIIQPFELFFHASRGGIKGDIMPISNERNDFGTAFYIGTNEMQAKALVLHDEKAYVYDIRIDKGAITEKNTLYLTNEEWIYFVLYNRGYLEPVKNTSFYDYIRHLADGKDFVIGPVADDVLQNCLYDFEKNYITDFACKQIMDSFHFELQIAAKTPHACSMVHKLNEKKLISGEDKRISTALKKARYEKEKAYHDARLKYIREHKGFYLADIFDQIKRGCFEFPYRNTAL